jgi:hypothetical protein
MVETSGTGIQWWEGVRWWGKVLGWCTVMGMRMECYTVVESSIGVISSSGNLYGAGIQSGKRVWGLGNSMGSAYGDGKEYEWYIQVGRSMGWHVVVETYIGLVYSGGKEFGTDIQWWDGNYSGGKE